MKPLRFLLLAAALLFSACQSSAPDGTVAVPRLPAWQQPADARVFTFIEVFSEAIQHAPGAFVESVDDQYTLVSYDWLQRYLSWEWSAGKAAGVVYTPESFDCDDFAFGFYFFLHMAAAEAGVKTSPLVARLEVILSATAAHAVNAVATDRGIFIVEPQFDAGAYRLTPIADYKPQIRKVSFRKRGRRSSARSATQRLPLAA